MTSARHFFSETEKTCLLELIKKHELHSGLIRSALEKQLRWVQITEEYNCVENNSKVMKISIFPNVIIYSSISLYNTYIVFILADRKPAQKVMG